MKQFALALLALVLTAGCSHSDSQFFDEECNISCKDGFRTTIDGSCKDKQATIDALSNVHGGCSGPLITIF